MDDSDQQQPDGPMSAEQMLVAESLSDEMVQKIDSVLLSNADCRNRKVAMIVGLTMMDESVRVPGLPDLYYAERVKVLVRNGMLVAEGNLDYMRYSEVRLPQRKPRHLTIGSSRTRYSGPCSSGLAFSLPQSPL